MISYKNIEAKHIVFAEGFGVKQNPFFKDLPLSATKGELLNYSCARFEYRFCIKIGCVFNSIRRYITYIVGATYEWTRFNHNTITQKAKE